MNRYEITIDYGKPASYFANGIDEIIRIIKEETDNLNYDELPYMDIQIYDNLNKKDLTVIIMELVENEEIIKEKGWNNGSL